MVLNQYMTNFCYNAKVLGDTKAIEIENNLFKQ